MKSTQYSINFGGPDIFSCRIVDGVKICKEYRGFGLWYFTQITRYDKIHMNRNFSLEYKTQYRAVETYYLLIPFEVKYTRHMLYKQFVLLYYTQALASQLTCVYSNSYTADFQKNILFRKKLWDSLFFTFARDTQQTNTYNLYFIVDNQRSEDRKISHRIGYILSEQYITYLTSPDMVNTRTEVVNALSNTNGIDLTKWYYTWESQKTDPKEATLFVHTHFY